MYSKSLPPVLSEKMIPGAWLNVDEIVRTYGRLFRSYRLLATARLCGASRVRVGFFA